MMGAGKTYIGDKLNKLLVHFDYIDTDILIEKQQGISISEIFEKHSESYFREIESEIIAQTAKMNNTIISIGGGAIENLQNLEFLKKNGVVFYLKAPAIVLFDRIKNENHRPLIKGETPYETFKSILKKREKNYCKADYVIDTNQKRAYTILNDIIHGYEKYVSK